MTPQEEQLLNGLIQRVEQTQLPEKDQEAEQLLRRTLGQNADALYILCQTVLVQQYALDQAQRQLEEARQQMSAVAQQQTQPEKHTSFLGGLFGGGRQDPPVQQPQPGYGPPQTQGGWSQLPPGYVQQGAYGQTYGGTQYGAPQYAPAPSGGFGGGGFLQGAMQTAAGVAAGELAFRGIEDLMHGFGHEAGYGSDRSLGGFGDRHEVINNYYGGDEHSGHDSFGDRLQAADGGGGLSPDVEDRRGEHAGSGEGFLGDNNDPSQSAFADDIQDDGAGDFDSGDDGGGFDSDDNSSF